MGTFYAVLRSDDSFIHKETPYEYSTKDLKTCLAYNDTFCHTLDCLLQCDPPLSLSVPTLYQRINWINSGLDATYQQQAPWHGTIDMGH